MVKFGVDISLMRILNESLRVWMSLSTSCFDLVCLLFLVATLVLLLLLVVVVEGVVVVVVVECVVVVVLIDVEGVVV